MKIDIRPQFRLSYLPPLMVYLAAGVSGLTGIVGTFFVKDYLGLSAEFLAMLGFWAGLPWALKMPLGHVVDLFWRWKFLLVFLGAGLIGASLDRYIRDELYWVLHAPRQTGKTTFLQSWMHEINAGTEAVACYVSLDIIPIRHILSHERCGQATSLAARGRCLATVLGFGPARSRISVTHASARREAEHATVEADADDWASVP